MIGKFQFLRSLVLSKKVNKKIIVIESDDWGSERIPNSEVREELATLGIDMESISIPNVANSSLTFE
jgi:hypothetical protein